MYSGVQAIIIKMIFVTMQVQLVIFGEAVGLGFVTFLNYLLVEGAL